jgi:hypothetical protein
MSTPNDGGPAFPIQPFRQPNGDFDWGRDGMSLRDYFAAAALQGVLANPARFDGWTESAERAYRFADAMLAKREVKP